MKCRYSHEVQKNILLLFIYETEFLCCVFPPSNHSTQPYHSYYMLVLSKIYVAIFIYFQIKCVIYLNDFKYLWKCKKSFSTITSPCIQCYYFEKWHVSNILLWLYINVHLNISSQEIATKYIFLNIYYVSAQFLSEFFRFSVCLSVLCFIFPIITNHKGHENTLFYCSFCLRYCITNTICFHLRLQI